MALFSLCNKLLPPFRTYKIVFADFHSLRKLDGSLFAKKNVASSITQKRNVFWIFKKRSKREIRAKDQPPEPYEMIYRNGMDHYFLAGQYGSFFMSIGGTIAVIYGYEVWTDSRQTPLGSQKGRPINNQLLGIYAAFIFNICLFYFYLARIPMRIYYHPQKQKYLLYTYGAVPNQVKRQILRVSDIQPLPTWEILPWSSDLFQHKNGQKFILFENYFRNPADLYVLLGWQKDPNIKGYERIEEKK